MLPTQKPKKVWQAGAAPAVADWEEELDRELEFFTEGMEDLPRGGTSQLKNRTDYNVELDTMPEEGRYFEGLGVVVIPTEIPDFTKDTPSVPNSKKNSKFITNGLAVSKAEYEDKKNELVKMIADYGLNTPNYDLNDDFITSSLNTLVDEGRKNVFLGKALEYRQKQFYFQVFTQLDKLKNKLQPIYENFLNKPKTDIHYKNYLQCLEKYMLIQNLFNDIDTQMKTMLLQTVIIYGEFAKLANAYGLTALKKDFDETLQEVTNPQPAAAAASTGPPPAAAPAPAPAPAPPAAPATGPPPAAAPAAAPPAPAPPAPAPAPAPPPAPDPSAAAAGSASPVPAPPDPSAAPQPAASKVTRGPGVGGAELSETVLFDSDFNFLPEIPYYMSDNILNLPGSQFSIDNATKWNKFYVDICDKFTKLEKQVRSQSNSDSDFQSKLLTVLNNLCISQLFQRFWQALLNSHNRIHPFYEKSKNQKFEKSSAEYIQYKKIMDVHDKILALFIGVKQQISAELKKPSPEIQTGVLFPEDKVKKYKELYESLLTLTGQSNASSSSKQASKKSSSSESDVPTTTFSKRASRADPTDVTELQELLEQTRKWGLQMRAAAQENYRIAQKVREFFGAGYEFGEPEAKIEDKLPGF